MSALVVTLPGLAPSANKLYSRNRNGSLRLSAAAESWIGFVAGEVRNAALAAEWRADPCSRWTLHLVVRLPAWTRDIDNLIKPTVDGIKQAIRVDDRYLVRLLVERESGPAQTRISVELAE